MLSRGFTPLANTIIEYKDELGVNWKEIGLISSVLKCIYQNKPIIKDKDLFPDGKIDNKTKRFTRQRNALKAKGYLEITVIKDYDDGFKTRGIKYDFSGLWQKIKELVERDEALHGGGVNAEEPKEPTAKNQINTEHLLFFQIFNKLHFEILDFQIDFEKQEMYKKHLLKHYRNRNRELAEINIAEIKNAYKNLCLAKKQKSEKELTQKQKSLIFQDTVGGLMFKPAEQNEKIENTDIIYKSKKAESLLKKYGLKKSDKESEI